MKIYASTTAGLVRALILLVTPMGEKFHPFAKNFIVGCDSQMETDFAAIYVFVSNQRMCGTAKSRWKAGLWRQQRLLQMP